MTLNDKKKGKTMRTLNEKSHAGSPHARNLFAMIFAALPFAVLANVWIGEKAANTVYTMADYSARENWQEDAAPSGASAVADFSAMTGNGVFVRIPESLTLGQAKGAAYAVRPVLVGEGTLNFSRGSTDPSLERISLYSSLRMDVYPRKMKLYQVNMCGDLYASPYYCSNGDANFRADRYAMSSNPVRETPWEASIWYFGANTTTLYAPCGSDEAVTATWTLVNGSPFAVRATGTAEHVLCAGTIVTVADAASGASLPSGTFLKRIFPDGSIELSEAAALGSDSADVSLEFAAFSPSLHVKAGTFRSEGNSATIRFAKYREKDDFRFEIGNLGMTLARTINTPDGFHPGTFVLHDAYNTPGVAFTLGNAHLEFAERTDGGTPGYSGTISFVNSSTITTRFTVTNGLSAVVGSFAGMKGTVVKDGAGMLTVGITNDFATTGGKLVVKGGTFKVVNADGAVQSAVASLAISNGATLKLPENGLKCTAFAAEAGATVEGPGFLVVPDVSAVDGVNFTGGAMAVTPAQLSLPAGGYTYDPPATNVVGDPAMWIDASRPETMTLVDVAGSGYKGVSRWNDVRGGEYCFLTNNGAHYPSLITNASGSARHVWMPQSSFRDGSYKKEDITNSFAMSFSRIITAKHIFQVMNAREGCGQFLGRNIAGYAYSRAQSPQWNDALFTSEYKDDSIQTNIPFYVNGCRKSVKQGFAYPGGYATTAPGDLLPLVSELHPGSISKTIGIDNFGFACYPSRDGRVRMYECLIYTNALSATEIEQVRGYLMKKWMNSEIDHDRYQGTGGEPLPAIADGNVTIASPAGKAVVVDSVSGAGELAKSGAGELYVNDLVDSSRDLHVAAGRMVVRSMEPELPGDPYFHGDASKSSSVTVNASTSKVTAWADRRGGDHPVATGHHTITYATDVKNSLSAIVLGSAGAARKANDYHDYAGFSLPECPDVRTVFSVMDTSGGGGFLLCNDDKKPVSYVSDAKMRGLYRNPMAYSNPIVNKSTYWGSSSASAQFAIAQSGPGATRAYVNGVATNLTTATFSGGWDLVALASRDPIAVNGITAGFHDSYYRGGGQILGEHVLYRETLCDESLKRVQAYLRKKWYGVSTPGYRPAEVDALEVDEGATLAVYGGAPVAARSLSGAGAVDGSVMIADGGTLSVEIAVDGSLALPSITGDLSAAGGGTVVLSGAYRALAAGRYALATVSGDWSGWTAKFYDGEDHNRSLALSASGGTLWLTVVKAGFIVIVE